MDDHSDSIKECPRDAYPLTADGFCSRCQEKPTFPPPRMRHNRKSGVGTGYYANVRTVKRYEFEDHWRDKVASQEEVNRLTVGLALDAVAGLHDGQSWREYVEALKSNNDLEAFKEAEARARELSEAAFEVLAESDDVEKVSVEPTAWDEFAEAQISISSTIRAGEGVYFGLTDAATSSFSAVFSFISILDPTSLLQITTKVGGIGNAFRKLFKIYYRLSGDQKVVFEAIHKFSEEARRINYDEHHHSSNAYGSRGPTLMEIQQMLAEQLTPDKVRDAVDALKDKGIIDKNDRSMWHIRF